MLHLKKGAKYQFKGSGNPMKLLKVEESKLGRVCVLSDKVPQGYYVIRKYKPHLLTFYSN